MFVGVGFGVLDLVADYLFVDVVRILEIVSVRQFSTYHFVQDDA